MKLRIRHNTKYNYESAVFFEPHYFRFRPRSGPHLTLLSYNFSMSPQPEGTHSILDPEGNLIQLCWFSGLHPQLTVEVETEVELKEFNPFGFLIQPAEYDSFPFQYTPEILPVLKPALEHIALEKDLMLFAEQLAETSGRKTITFLSLLTKKVFETISLQIREDGPPHSPEITFGLKEGSCRDLSWMQIQILRYLGFATRFVSGYLYLDTEDPEFELHAWLEVYLPGAGWIGLDPSHGVFADRNYVAVASSVRYEHTMPVTGSVRGNAQATLVTELEIQKVTAE